MKQGCDTPPQVNNSKLLILNLFTMSRSSSNKKSRTPIWVAICAIFLIILLIIWLTFADLTGNTDVAAFIAPYIVNTPA